MTSTPGPRRGRPRRWWLLALAICLAFALPTAGAAATTITCLGDSLTAGYGLEEDQAYPHLVEQLATHDHRDWRIINAGVSGDTTADGLTRVPWVLRAHPQAVFIALGGNDGLRGLPVETSRANLRAIITRLRAGGAVPLLAGMQLPTNYGAEYRTAFAAIFPALAAAEHVPLLPFLLEGVGGVPRLNQVDGIHPTVEGQRLIAGHVYAFLVAQWPVISAGVVAGTASTTTSASSPALTPAPAPTHGGGP